ncbi:MAG: molybdopterin cofactor-binding domain-containing protein, partial [bacterium]
METSVKEHHHSGTKNYRLMATRWFGERVTRNEDPRLLAGRGTYVDDIQPPRLLHAAFVRSPHAHARIIRIDTAQTKALPGVAAVFTAADLPAAIRGPLPRLIPHPTLIHHKTQVALAGTFVHHVGEPIVMVVAESRYIAEDGADLVEAEFEPLPAVVDLEDAAGPGSPTVHEDLDTNVAAHHTQRVGNVDEAWLRAPHVFRERFVMDRGSSSPIETRGIVALWDARTRYLTVWDSTQAPIRIRNFLSQLFSLPQSSIRVIAPDIGGGFGPKIMMCYPEEILIPHAAMALGLPVKWIEVRREHFVATNHERQQIHDAE